MWGGQLRAECGVEIYRRYMGDAGKMHVRSMGDLCEIVSHVAVAAVAATACWRRHVPRCAGEGITWRVSSEALPETRGTMEC